MKNYVLIHESMPDYDRDPTEKSYYLLGPCADDTEALKKADELIKKLGLGEYFMSMRLTAEIGLFARGKWFDPSRNGRVLDY